jgi:hypothetical protein
VVPAVADEDEPRKRRGTGGGRPKLPTDRATRDPLVLAAVRETSTTALAGERLGVSAARVQQVVAEIRHAGDLPNDIDELLRARRSGRIAEDEIVRGYSRARGQTGRAVRVDLRRERCAVDGQMIVAPANDWTAIAIAVRAHNLSTVHQQAAHRLGYD